MRELTGAGNGHMVGVVVPGRPDLFKVVRAPQRAAPHRIYAGCVSPVDARNRIALGSKEPLVSRLNPLKDPARSKDRGYM